MVRRRLPAVSLTSVFALALVLGTGAGCRGGCSRGGISAGPAGGALAWFPAETQVVVAIDFGRLRATPLWSRLASLVTTNPADRSQIDELVRRTGFDPLKQIDSLVVAFPEEARGSGGMGLVMVGKGFDEARLVAYVRDQVAKQGDDLFSFRRAGRTMWATRREPTAAAFFADNHTFVLGTGGWAEKMAERGRAGAPAGAESNQVLAHLIERAGFGNPIWAAALVPDATRTLLAADPALASGAGVSHLALGINVGAGLEAKLIADLATRQQAEAMTGQIGDAVRAAKQSPQALLMGVGPYLDSIMARTVGVSTEIVVKLSQTQLDDGVERLGALLTLARQAAVPGFPHP